jgi:uncharacterized damage-inducible protein DinB
MNGALREVFRHNSWSSRYLLEACRKLSPEQLHASATGTYGSILDTFNHLVLAEAGYQRRLTGDATDWADRARDADLDEIANWIDDLERRWEEWLNREIDAEAVLPARGDRGRFEVRAGVVIAQVIYHGNVHREQICSIITSLGIEPPDLQPWEYALNTGRMWPAGENV